jgi:D-amino peptidase
MMRALVTAIVCVAMWAAPAARQGKKVYISVDLEGISGVNADDQTSAGQPEYGRARKLMAEDANAAIRGAFGGGATDVLVNDSHGSQRNLLPEDLDPRARLITLSFKRHGMMEGLDETFDAVIFIGYHAKADAPRGLFAHTGSGVVRDLQINGRSVGEGGMNALLAAWYGVPVVVVSGDDVAVAEVKEAVPSIRGVAVKRAINVRAAELKPLQAARTEIFEASHAAAAGPVQGAAALPQLHLPGSRDRLPRDRIGGARHGGVHPRHDARGLPLDSRALPIRQSGLIGCAFRYGAFFATTRPNGRHSPVFERTRSRISISPVGSIR